MGSYSSVCTGGSTIVGLSSCVSSEQSKKTLIIGFSVAFAGLVHIANALIIIILFVRLIKRNKRISIANVAYQSNTCLFSLKSNAAYITTSDQGPAIHTNTNEAYALPTSINEAYGVTAATNENNDITTTTNDACVTTDIPTSPNKAYISNTQMFESHQSSHLWLCYMSHTT